MTIMPSHLPVSATGITTEVVESVTEVFPLYAEVQRLARLGITAEAQVAPSSIVVTLTVAPAAMPVLPALLAEIDQARTGSLPEGQLVVTGEMCQGTVTLRVVVPRGWVSEQELAVLAGTADADPSSLL